MEELKELINGQAVEIEHPIWGAKIITDLSVGFKITELQKLSLELTIFLISILMQILAHKLQ
jgi:hypothetical protein